MVSEDEFGDSVSMHFKHPEPLPDLNWKFFSGLSTPRRTLHQNSFHGTCPHLGRSASLPSTLATSYLGPHFRRILLDLERWSTPRWQAPGATPIPSANSSISCARGRFGKAVWLPCLSTVTKSLLTLNSLPWGEQLCLQRVC